jgi:hypothetical protein
MIPHEWIFSHRCSWITVYVFYRNAQSKPHSDPHDVCMLSLLYQLPNCNLFTQHAYLSYGETPLVNCGPRYNFLYIITPFYFTRTVYFTCITIILLPLDTLIPLFTANCWDWHPHRKLGAKYLFVLCAGFTLLLGEEAPTHWVPNWSVIYIINTTPSTIFLVPLLGRNKTSAREVSHAQCLLCFSFALLQFWLHRFIENTNN